MHPGWRGGNEIQEHTMHPWGSFGTVLFVKISTGAVALITNNMYFSLFQTHFLPHYHFLFVTTVCLPYCNFTKECHTYILSTSWN